MITLDMHLMVSYISMYEGRISILNYYLTKSHIVKVLKATKEL